MQLPLEMLHALHLQLPSSPVHIDCKGCHWFSHPAKIGENLSADFTCGQRGGIVKENNIGYTTKWRSQQTHIAFHHEDV